MLDTNLKNNDDLEMKNAGNENVTNGNVVKKNHNCGKLLCGKKRYRINIYSRR